MFWVSVDELADRMLLDKFLSSYVLHIVQVRDGPFNFQGEGRGLCIFSKIYILIPNVAEEQC
jgi:hypothetical protein